MDFSHLQGFEWDEGNLRKVLARMEPRVAEMAFQGSPWIGLSRKHSRFEPRWFLVNRVMGHPVFVIFTVRGQKIRVISARYMHQKEVKSYEKRFQKEA